MPIRAVLFDVGGPLATELEHERLIDADIRAGFERHGIDVTDEAYAEAWRFVIDSFAPNAYQAVIWRLVGGDVAAAEAIYAEVSRRSHERSSFELREGVPEMLAALSNRGLKLGLAANQPAKVLDRLREHGIADYFDSREVSGHHGYHKPDPRLFLWACEKLDVAPDECVMIGDRVDNDIAPAKALGMRTVRIRTGHHATQEARTWHELPDAEATHCPSMLAAIEAMLD